MLKRLAVLPGLRLLLGALQASQATSPPGDLGTLPSFPQSVR